MGWFTIRRVERELEAHLMAPFGGGVRGKAERKWYSDGGERLKIKARDLDLSDGSALSVRIAGRAAGTLTVRRGRAELDLEAPACGTVPDAALGETLVVEHGGETVLRGDFRED